MFSPSPHQHHPSHTLPSAAVLHAKHLDNRLGVPAGGLRRTRADADSHNRGQPGGLVRCPAFGVPGRGDKGPAFGVLAAEQSLSANAGQQSRQPLAATSHQHLPRYLLLNSATAMLSRVIPCLPTHPAGLQRRALLCGAHAERQQPRGVAVPGALLPLFSSFCFTSSFYAHVSIDAVAVHGGVPPPHQLAKAVLVPLNSACPPAHPLPCRPHPRPASPCTSARCRWPT